MQYHNAFIIFSGIDQRLGYAVVFLPSKERKSTITDEKKNIFGMTAVTDKL